MSIYLSDLNRKDIIGEYICLRGRITLLKAMW